MEPEPTLSLRHGASVIARALVPIAGVLFLGWSSGNLLIIYFADTLASFFSVSVLAAGRLTAAAETGGPAWYQRISTGLQLAANGALLTAIIGLVPFGFLVFMLSIQDFVWHFALHDRDLWIGIGAQFCAAVTFLLSEYRRIEAEKDADRIIKARFGLVFMRWVFVCGVFFAAVEVLQPQRGGVLATIFGFVLVLAYAVATILMELQPQRLLAAFAPELAAGEPTNPAKSKRPGSS